MSWAQSLIRIADYEVELLQKRLADIADRRVAMEMRAASLEAEAVAEAEEARRNAEACFYHAGFLQGWRARKDKLAAELGELEAEEEGARDALSHAFEELKKYEQIAEGQQVAARKTAAKRETAEMDELGLRKAAGGR